MKTSRIAACLAAFSAALLVFAPRVVLACSVCMSGRDDQTRAAFVATTALLTFLPLLMVGGLLWWLRRRALALERAEEAELVALARLESPPSRTSSSR